MRIAKVICNLFIIISVMLCLLCILWIYAGSLEMYPTAEMEGKAEIAAMAGIVIFGASASACVIIKKKWIR